MDEVRKIRYMVAPFFFLPANRERSTEKESYEEEVQSLRQQLEVAIAISKDLQNWNPRMMRSIDGLQGRARIAPAGTGSHVTIEDGSEKLGLIDIEKLK